MADRRTGVRAGGRPDQRLDEEAKVFVISVAAELAGMHPQTLRTYDRLGLVSPARTAGGGRRYSARDVALLREVAQLSAEGVNLAGVKRVILLEAEVAQLRARVGALLEELAAARAAVVATAQAVHASYRRDLVPVSSPGTVALWQGSRRKLH